MIIESPLIHESVTTAPFEKVNLCHVRGFKQFLGRGRDRLKPEGVFRTIFTFSISDNFIFIQISRKSEITPF